MQSVGQPEAEVKTGRGMNRTAISHPAQKRVPPKRLVFSLLEEREKLQGTRGGGGGGGVGIDKGINVRERAEDGHSFSTILLHMVPRPQNSSLSLFTPIL